MEYNPQRDVDPQAWLALEEHERIEAVKRYHRRKNIRLPNPQVHALVHMVVENQVALGDEYVAKSVLLRLMDEGLSRHEAIHAMASVLSTELFDLLKHNPTKNFAADYMAKLTRLTAESWKREFSQE
jgi:hypothetical protein